MTNSMSVYEMHQKKTVLYKNYLWIFVHVIIKLVVLTEGGSGRQAARPTTISFMELMNGKVDLQS